jgi:DNA-binding CsgD family transcriptional regulator/tetratricopeptide (TPR) repeat protein
MRSSRLIGREPELDQLRRTVSAVREGEPALVLVDGEAGIGKTRLVGDAVALLRRPGDLVAVGHGVAASGGELPFGVVSDLLRDLVRQTATTGLDDATTQALGALAPVAANPARDQTRAEIFYALAVAIEQLAHVRMLWLVFEDLHWADSSSRDLIDYLLRVVGHCQMLALCTRRTRDAPQSPALQSSVAELLRHPRADRLTLHRLTDEQVVDQVTDILGRAPEPQLLRRVVALSQGNPFLTEELVSAPSDGVRSVDELMLARLGGLSHPAQQLVHAAAVGDGQLAHALLARVCGLPGAEAESAVAEAVAANVLEIDDSGDGYRFRHALLREAVADAVLPVERERWHRRWAEQLDADPGRLAPELAVIAAAHHWAGTNDVARAFDAAITAELAADSMHAPAEQALMNLRILQLWPRVPDARQRAPMVRLDYAWTAIDALNRSEAWESGLDVIERELEAADAVASPEWRIWLQLSRANCARELGLEIDEPLDIDADVTSLLQVPADRNHNLVIDTCLEYGQRARNLGHLAAADLLFEHAAEVSDLMTDPERLATHPLVDVRTTRRTRWDVKQIDAIRHWSAGRSQEALELVGRLQPDARAAGHDGLNLMIMYCNLLHGVGRPREAAAVGRQALRLIEDPQRDPSTWFYSAWSVAEPLFALGEWDEVDALLQTSANTELSGGKAGILGILSANLSCARGDLDAAERSMESAERSLPEGAAVPPEARSLGSWVRAEIAAARGQTRKARAQLASTWTRMGHWETRLKILWNPVLLAARVEADAPDPGSPDRVAKIREVASGLHRRGDLGVAWSTHLDAELLRYAGSTDPEPWQAAAAAWSAIEQVHDQAWALFRQAGCHLHIGDKPAAIEPLTLALQIGERLRARPLVDAVSGLSRRARVDIGGEAHPHPGTLPLTQREISVLELVAAGYSNTEIAKKLYISPKTASVHVSHILAKLDVRTRTEAAMIAHRRHLID